MTPAYFAEKPEPATPASRQFRNSTIKSKDFGSRVEAAKRMDKKRKPIAKKNPINRAKRAKRNQDYYSSAEWKAKKKAVHERDGFRCVEMIPYGIRASEAEGTVWLRCPNYGTNISGKQTARGLVAEEKSYGHRGIPGNIDRIVTRCKDCDRRLTPFERANHAHGFGGRRG
jgi:hypothetical protein